MSWLVGWQKAIYSLVLFVGWMSFNFTVKYPDKRNENTSDDICIREIFVKSANTE